MSLRKIDQENNHILIIDDDSIDQLIFTYLLEDQGYIVHNARNLQEGLEQVLINELSLILLDIIFPDDDGFEICKAIKHHPNSNAIPVIFLTSVQDYDNKARAFLVGGDDFINKDGDLKELLIRMKSLIQISNYTKKIKELNKILNYNQLEIDDNLKAAAKIKEAIFPKKDPKFPHLHISWVYLPSKIVGGDFFNFIRLGQHQYGFYLLDVCGHGVHSAMMGVSIQQAILAVERDTALRKILYSPLNLLEFLDKEYSYEKYDMGYTFCYCYIDTETKDLIYSLGGHLPIILLNPKKPSKILREGGSLPGFGKSVPFKEEKIKLDIDDTIISYTDGTLDVCDPEGNRFGQTRFYEFLEKNKHHTLENFQENLLKTLRDFSKQNQFPDDLTFVCMRLKNSSINQ